MPVRSKISRLNTGRSGRFKKAWIEKKLDFLEWGWEFQKGSPGASKEQ